MTYVASLFLRTGLLFLDSDKILPCFHSYCQEDRFKERKFFNYGRVFPAWSIHTESGRGGSQCQVSSRHSISHHLALNLHLWACWAQYKRCAWISDKILEFRGGNKAWEKVEICLFLYCKTIYIWWWWWSQGCWWSRSLDNGMAPSELAIKA